MRLLILLAVASATLCVACPTSSGSSGAVPEAAPGQPTCAAVCANVLTNVPQCPEGHFTDCATACNVIQVDSHQVKPNLAQLATATTVAQVRAAGWTCRMDGG